MPCTAHRTTEAIWNDLAEPKQLVIDVAISKLCHIVRHEASSLEVAVLTGDVEGGWRSVAALAVDGKTTSASGTTHRDTNCHELRRIERLGNGQSYRGLPSLDEDSLMIRYDSQQEAQLMLTTGSTHLAVSRGQQTWYHSTCYHRRRNRGGRGGLGPLTFLFEGPNMPAAPSLLKNAAPSLS